MTEKRLFLVPIQEVHTSYRLVLASSVDEAREEGMDAASGEIFIDYNRLVSDYTDNADDDYGEIESFTLDELKKAFPGCHDKIKEVIAKEEKWSKRWEEQG